MYTTKEQEGILQRLLQYRIVSFFILPLVLVLLLVFGVTTGSRTLSCSPALLTGMLEDIRFDVVEETGDYTKIDLTSSSGKYIGFLEVATYPYGSNETLNIEVALRDLIDPPQLQYGDLISTSIIKITDQSYRNQGLGRFLFLESLKIARSSHGAHYRYVFNYAHVWTEHAPKDFNPWNKPLQECFRDDQITQLRPWDPWREVLVKLD